MQLLLAKVAAEDPHRPQEEALQALASQVSPASTSQTSFSTTILGNFDLFLTLIIQRVAINDGVEEPKGAAGAIATAAKSCGDRESNLRNQQQLKNNLIQNNIIINLILLNRRLQGSILLCVTTSFPMQCSHFRCDSISFSAWTLVCYAKKYRGIHTQNLELLIMLPLLLYID